MCCGRDTPTRPGRLVTGCVIRLAEAGPARAELRIGTDVVELPVAVDHADQRHIEPGDEVDQFAGVGVAAPGVDDDRTFLAAYDQAVAIGTLIGLQLTRQQADAGGDLDRVCRQGRSRIRGRKHQ